MKLLFSSILLFFVFKSFNQSNDKGFKSLFVNNTFDSSKDYNQQLDPRAISFVKDYVKKQGKELEKMKSWGKSYFTLYDGILKQYNIPTQMKYLSVIESHLQHDLVSWAGAVGPWQIMDYEAKRYGLRMGRIDDRMDYTKSTHCACKLMNELYKEFKDWILVVAAYNGGAGRVRGAIRKSGSRDFWNFQYLLMEETRNHVKKFIGTHFIFEGKGQIENLSPSLKVLDSTITNNLDSTTLKGRYTKDIICKYLELDPNLFMQFNPTFIDYISATKPFILKLPKEKMELFINKKYIILQECIDKLFNK